MSELPDPIISPEMTLRDYFAAAVLTGLCAQPNIAEMAFEQLAISAYHCADAMLKARGVK